MNCDLVEISPSTPQAIQTSEKQEMYAECIHLTIV